MISRRTSPVAAALVALALAVTALGGPAAADESVPPDAPCGAGVPLDRNAPADDPVVPGAYFSFPNTTAADATAIRDEVLRTINSTNGAYCVQDGFLADGTTPRYVVRHGSIKIATWSYNDWDITHALVDADARGVSVQVVAARSINELTLYQPWIAPDGLRQSLGYHRDPVPAALLDDDHSWAHDCKGACRGPGGTPHSKYFLFDDVRSVSAGDHLRHVVMQSSANLTRFAFEGQWNQANALYDAESYTDFVTNFYQAARELHGGYSRSDHGGISDIFFPKGRTGQDPSARLLAGADCRGGTTVRAVNYAFYSKRGVALARQLRGLWNRGCDVRVIYAITSRGVLRVLRARGGRGPIPVRQSVIRNNRGRVVEYNHSKWVSVGDRVLAGSGNWSNSSLNDDEQFQEFSGSAPFQAAFDKTWSQASSKAPRGGRLGDGSDSAPVAPRWGRGELQYLTPEG